tara:strand:+ start:1348 stop:2763 length:1416 start_codon:yes stop_codon:yes gene_type:complete
MTVKLSSILFLLVLFVCRTETIAKPNLLIIQTDEHHFGTLGCYGGDIVDTQHIDWLAEHGVLCTSYYAVTPVCSPSRASFISGRYPQKTPVVTNNIPLNDGVVTFASILKQQGYATGFAGKWHLDGGGKPQWSPERKFGFDDNRYMFNRGHWKNLEIKNSKPRVGARNAQNQPTYSLAGADARSFSTDFLCDRAVEFIQEHRDEPFCYYISLPDPHGPNTVRAPYDTMYADVKVPIPTTLMRTPGQTPKWGKGADVTAAQLRKIMPAYYGMVKCIDDNVGKLIQTLRDEELLENTIIVFTSDHGDLCGEHGRLNKGVPYEGSARVPFIVYAPWLLPEGRMVNEALTTVDFFSTILPMMDVQGNYTSDGRNATRLLQGTLQKPWEDIAFLRSTPGNEWLAAVSAQYKLVISAADTPWLIDVQNDPNEVVNLFGNPKYARVAAKMRAGLVQYVRTHNDTHARIPQIQAQLSGR